MGSACGLRGYGLTWQGIAEVPALGRKGQIMRLGESRGRGEGGGLSCLYWLQGNGQPSQHMQLRVVGGHQTTNIVMRGGGTYVECGPQLPRS